MNINDKRPFLNLSFHTSCLELLSSNGHHILTSATEGEVATLFWPFSVCVFQCSCMFSHLYCKMPHDLLTGFEFNF